MPAPQASMMQNFAKLKFLSFNLKLPTEWRSRSQQMEYSGRKQKPEEIAQAAMNYFKPATALDLHTETAKTVSKQMEDYSKGITSAICSAWSQTQSLATLAGVVINAVTAAGGQVVWPPMTPLILANGPKSTPQEMKYTKTIANVIGTQWMQFTATIKVPGLPWYPAFAAFPGPIAPPMPNVPGPVAMLTQVPVSISASVLKSQMVAQHGDPQALHHQQLFESIADAFEKCYNLWKVSTMVTNVLGTGPIPTFAPPYVPVGPVVAGVGNMTPGGFA